MKFLKTKILPLLYVTILLFSNLVGQDISEKADISFFVLSVKYNNDSFKIISLEKGIQKNFNDYDKIHPSGAMSKMFWNYLNQFRLPVWYINPNIKDSVKESQKACFEYFKREVKFIQNISQIKKDPLFMAIKKQRKIISNTIRKHKGIIVLKNIKTLSPVIKKFKQKNPLFLVLDDAAEEYMHDNYKAHLLFDTPFLKEFRPICKMYKKKQYSQLFAQQVINDFLEPKLVIKPIKTNNKKDIIVSSYRNLDQNLKKFTGSNLTKKQIQFSRNIDRDESFLIETYEQSKKINCSANPTLKIACALHYEHGQIHITFFDGYWKLNNNKKKDTLSSIKASKEDIATVKKVLQEVMPYIYFKMLENRK